MNEDLHYMASLKGSIRLYKRILDNPLAKRDPICYFGAFVQLILLAVDRKSAPQTFYVRGIPVTLERGQVGWSQERLAAIWMRSREWVTSFLKYAQDQGSIIVKTSATGTVITIVNYDVYQLDDPAAEPTPDQTPNPAHKGKGVMVKGNGKGVSDPTEVPSDEEVGAFCAGFVDLALGIQGIPEGWWTGWLANQLGTGRPFPRHWQRMLALAFKSDFANRHPKATGSANGGAKKMAATSGSQPGGKGGKSLAQTQFELAKELEQVQERLETCYNNGIRPDQGDVKREKELEAEIAAMGVQAPGQ